MGQGGTKSTTPNFLFCSRCRTQMTFRAGFPSWADHFVALCNMASLLSKTTCFVYKLFCGFPKNMFFFHFGQDFSRFSVKFFPVLLIYRSCWSQIGGGSTRNERWVWLVLSYPPRVVRNNVFERLVNWSAKMRAFLCVLCGKVPSRYFSKCQSPKTQRTRCVQYIHHPAVLQL